MKYLRRTLVHRQTTYEEGGKPVGEPTLLVAALAIIQNPLGRARVCGGFEP